MSIHCW